MRNLTLIALLFLAGAANAEDMVVFEGTPISRVSSNEDTTVREKLTEAESKEYRVLIVKRDDKYFWASREDKELFYYKSGLAHWFIAPTTGYIKIIDPRLFDPESNQPMLVYVEHLGLVTTMITYWGVGEGGGL